MRAFVGLPLPWQAAETLAHRAAGAGVGRAVGVDDLHLTLAFLDEQSEAALMDLHEELALIRAAPLRLEFGAPEFLGQDRSRVFALSVHEDAGLSDLHQRVRGAVRAAGIAAPPARFRPHVTLIRLPRHVDPAAQARLQGLIDRGAASGVSAPTVDRMALWRSHLAPSGARYEILGEYPLY